MKMLFAIVIIILVGGFVFFRLFDKWLIYKEKEAGRIYCTQHELTFIKVDSYELHSRLYFEKDGIKSWANYETDKKNIITWKKESPLDKLESLKSKKIEPSS